MLSLSPKRLFFLLYFSSNIQKIVLGLSRFATEGIIRGGGTDDNIVAVVAATARTTGKHMQTKMTRQERSAELCRLSFEPEGFGKLLLLYHDRKRIPVGVMLPVGITTSYVIEEILKVEYPGD